MRLDDIKSVYQMPGDIKAEIERRLAEIDADNEDRFDAQLRQPVCEADVIGKEIEQLAK